MVVKGRNNSNDYQRMVNNLEQIIMNNIDLYLSILGAGLMLAGLLVAKLKNNKNIYLIMSIIIGYLLLLGVGL